MTTKTALVTGAAAGIGRACALRLAKDGINIGVLDLDQSKAQVVADEIVAAGGKAVGLGGNIADRASIEAAVGQLREAFGPVTIVVNNAGIAPFIPFEELTDADWDKVFEINTKGTFIVTQTVLPDMKAAGWGRVVNISSSSAIGGSYQQVAYSASKGAVVSMTRSLAQAVGQYGITVNNIPPGSVMGTVMADAANANANFSAEQIARAIPVRRTGVPEDIAGACAYLVSDEAGYVTGQTINVNGGRLVS
ncbi:SDR family NAD(P)-dependent oxidoreductase [Pseudomaricurvus sp. HS19]|uniref:SDR family NAD(P)-dependent oxidoreductase n=1 Tax=Pseudomaricurvus sp. HS19 TaxID=2692626 RepID=UPI00136FB0CC|nr:SDR family NAD(P)-dependent oxidoreductase [Pseudomaricurvus sp. HS19]MYM63889.1 glucose 1-dehydrogenase [Pseudomaricurvus sp. HS19]